VLVAVVLAPLVARAAGESLEAEALIRQGVELRAKGKDERALPLFEKAYQTSRTPRTAGQLGLVELALGYFVEAERYLGEALASPDHPWVAKNLTMLKQQLDTAKGKIGELAVTGTPAGAEVWINGKPMGTLPLPAPVRLDKGRAEISLRAPGYIATTDTVTITGGKREDRAYALVREPIAAAPMPAPVPTAPLPAPLPAAPPPAASPTPPAPSPQPAPADEPSALRPWAWVLAGGAVAGLALGTVEALIARNKRDEFNNHMGLVNGLISKDCGVDALNAQCKPLKDAHDQAVTLSIVGFAAGGALAVGSLALFWLSSPKERAAATARAFTCAPNLATPGVTCALRF
jgi:hypothetical protein